MTIERINFACPIETRDGTLDKDSKAVNVVFERNGNFLDILKRPGLTYVAAPSGTAGVSRLLANLNGKILSCIADGSHSYLYQTDPSTYVATSIGSISYATTSIYSCKGPLEAWIFFNDMSYGYYLTKAGAFTTLTMPTLSVGQTFVPGAVLLNAYVFVGTTGNRIYNSKYQDASTWASTQNYVMFEQTTDTLVGIAKHLNYLVAFGNSSTQFYYDAGTYVDENTSPLGVAQSYTSEIGCASADSIVSTENTVIWMGKSNTHGRAIYMMDGVSAIPVSTNAIDRVLESSDLSKVLSYVYKFGGHTLYILTLHDIDTTLVYDMTAKEWVSWTFWNGSAEQYFIATRYTEVGGNTYCLGDDDGNVYTFRTDKYDDNGTPGPIYVRIVTEIKDNDSTHRKFYGRLEIVGDRESGSTMSIRHSGDDYRTWSNYRTVDLNNDRPQIYVGGSDRRRAWEFLHTSSTPLRLECAEIDFRIGEMDQEQGVGRRG